MKTHAKLILELSQIHDDLVTQAFATRSNGFDGCEIVAAKYSSQASAVTQAIAIIEALPDPDALDAAHVSLGEEICGRRVLG